MTDFDSFDRFVKIVFSVLLKNLPESLIIVMGFCGHFPIQFDCNLPRIRKEIEFCVISEISGCITRTIYIIINNKPP